VSKLTSLSKIAKGTGLLQNIRIVRNGQMVKDKQLEPRCLGNVHGKLVEMGLRKHMSLLNLNSYILLLEQCS
jgi:hypothetical protein